MSWYAKVVGRTLDSSYLVRESSHQVMHFDQIKKSILKYNKKTK